MDKIPQINENGWPKSLRRAVNWLIRRSNRQWTVQTEDVDSATFQMSEENVILVLPKFGVASLTGEKLIEVTGEDGDYIVGRTVLPATGTYIPVGIRADDADTWSYQKVDSKKTYVCVHDETGAHLEEVFIFTMPVPDP